MNLLQQASNAHQAGRLDEAQNLYGKLLSAEPGNAQALHLRGIACHQQNRHDEALHWIEKALAVKPAWPEALANAGVMLEALGRPADAVARYEASLKLLRSADTLNNLANALLSLGRNEEALASYDAAVAAMPNHNSAWNNRANALRALNRLPEALASFDKALAVQPQLYVIWNNRSTVARELKRYDEALTGTERALALNPNYADGWNGRGAVLLDMRREKDALACFDRALVINNAHADAWSNRGMVLYGQLRLGEALESFNRCLAIDPDHADGLYFRGFVLHDMKRPHEAIASFDRLAAHDPGHRYVLGGLAATALSICDWPRVGEMVQRMRDDAMDGRCILPPLLVLGYCDDPALQQQAAIHGARDRLRSLPPPLWKGENYGHDRIRIAYLSSDFYEHATAYLTAELFERHDRNHFEIIAVSYGPDDKSPMRARLMAGFDRFIDVTGKGDADVARLIRELEVDILVDLKGHTRGGRPEILAFRPAPVQVNYLGYPGTMGASFFDYVIADAITLPHNQQQFYNEQIVHLPGSYQPNDRNRAISDKTPTRAEAGLPPKGFVFCCFNNNYKITQDVFDIWMRLLTQLPGAVVWLLEDNGHARDNLIAAAAARGIDPARLIFAPRLTLPEHLARHRLADLFLDTLPYNAHTTASDALWAGLPLVTQTGKTFAGRVAASLLTAVGLPELVTHSAEEYEALVLALARDPARLKALRDRLGQNRATSALFDTEKFTRDIEAAYRQMHDRRVAGQTPEGFAVPNRN